MDMELSSAENEIYYSNPEQIKNGDIPISYMLDTRINVDSLGTYVLDLALNNKESCSEFAVALSTNIIKLFSTETKMNICTFKGHENTITDVKFSKSNSNLLYSSSTDGSIRLWDTREKSLPVKTFTDITDGTSKPLLSFDISLSENYICGGTELIREDAFLIFWDCRTTNNLGGYWDSHNNDITQVHYHPTKNSIMMSGSLDGLINIYDLSENTEDEALINTYNSESSIAKLMWQPELTKELDEHRIYCISTTEDVISWKCDQVEPYLSWNRIYFQNKNKDNVDYIVNCLQDNEDTYIVTANRNDKLHIWSVHETEATLWAQITNAHKEEVRAICWNYEDKTLFTGGEDSTVCIWKTSASENPKMSSELKKQRLKKKIKPY